MVKKVYEGKLQELEKLRNNQEALKSIPLSEDKNEFKM
eukprot:CAMPEP_0116889026 /NCGR_PEP_ID=MMETSP0463-20121206/24365_1 /TAXON_ID=181622 /ORGANISM="Strombidinopsis sp, Strain SopsisLIS2011" /LENGTH=37 /DNA_ID= /DNA_START= /DNA_END= /DNA_ORIENTATION=